ncbi:MAG TPA: HNH endonuclease [Xanthobacteraceae bacterium]|nr:HNH endonuclease [Xanthobacteraceae bacterium]
MKLSDANFRAWIIALCLASKDDGVLPAMDDVALVLRVSEKEALKRIESLIAAGLIDRNPDGALTPHNWAMRQFRSDDSTARVNRYRAKREAAGLTRSHVGYESQRPALMERDEGACVYCRSQSSLCIDHMIPIIQGGTDHQDNLAIACKSCNSGKSGRTPDQAGMEIVWSPAADALSRYLVACDTVTDDAA